MTHAALRRLQTNGEELANAITHGVGAALDLPALILLILRSAPYAGAKALTSCVIYAAALFVLFLASTLYHAVSRQRVKNVLQILDHSAIYLLIAGTYTPICLIVLPPVTGWVLFALEWALAITGIVLHAAGCRFLKKAELALYLLMGWALVAGGPALLRRIPPVVLLLLACGGALYSVGVVFYKKHHRYFFHVIWHCFVLAAAILQWAAIYRLVRAF